MKKIVLPVFILFGQLLSAQNFTFPPYLPFEGVDYSSVAFADVNGDTYPDVLIAGTTNALVTITQLYINDGSGTFSLVPDTPFEGVHPGSIVFADVNGDNTQDVLLGGEKLFMNDGSGNFTEMVGTPFENVYGESVAFADVDGDTDQDLLITAEGIASGFPIAKLYTNDGLGTFTEVPDTPFEGVGNSSVAFANVNGDAYPDVLITGRNGSGTPIAKLYTNDGSGTFTEVQGTPFEGVEFSSVAFADVNGDTYPDVLITGRNGSGTPIAKLYTNDGLGTFTEVPGTPFAGVNAGSVAIADVNGDNTQDVLITGSVGFLEPPIAKLYTNDGLGTFTEASGTLFKGVTGSVAFADVNGDNTQDVLITGSVGFFEPPIAKLYTNNGLGLFSEAQQNPFKGIILGSIAFANVDGDTSPDVLIAGYSIYDEHGSPGIALLYTNDGSGTYSEVKGPPVPSGMYSHVAFVDVNGDNTQDLFFSTLMNGGIPIPITKLLLNDGAGTFTKMLSTPFSFVYGPIAIANVDGDADQDVLIGGNKLYKNDGSGNFTEMVGTPFTGGFAAFADVDGDDDPDVLIGGNKLYTNDGSGNFTEMLGTPFEGGFATFADVNGDTFPDVLITGHRWSDIPIAKLYTNNGSGTFTEVPDTPFEGVAHSSVAFADVDGDTDQDLLITGRTDTGERIAQLYTNDGSGKFTEVPGMPFEGVEYGSVAFADVDGDTDQDLLITGFGSVSYISKLYINETMVSSIGSPTEKPNLRFTVYPNPAVSNGRVTISLNPEPGNPVRITVFDALGRRIQQQQVKPALEDGAVSLDISSLEKGVYLIQLENGEHTGIQKLIVH